MPGTIAVAAALTLIFMMCTSRVEDAVQRKSRAETQKNVATANVLTPAEKAAGWKLLFDGSTWNGWRGFRREGIPEEGWVIEGGSIKHLAGNGEQSKQGGDIITIGQYGNFEMQLEWRISPGGNSGIKYLVDEAMVKSGYSGLGFEMQVLDDERHPDARMGKAGNRTAGALYDLIAPRNRSLHRVGEWNQVLLIVQDNHVEHWLNGVKVVEYELGSTLLKTLIAESKYRDIKGFGEVRKGHILLQDHGNEVRFRNIKLREL